MANTNDTFGAIPVKTEGKQSRVTYYTKKAGVVIAPGDFVTADANGNVDLGVAAETLLGVAAEYKASADVSEIAVYDDPETVFEIQCSANLAAADVFQNAQILATTLDTALLQSKHALNSATLDVTSTHQLKVLGLSKASGNEFGSYAKALVKINNHALRTGVAGI